MSSKKNLAAAAAIAAMSFTMLTAFQGTSKKHIKENRFAGDDAPDASETGAGAVVPKGCVFKTVFEGETPDSSLNVKTPTKVSYSIDEGLEWMAEAQLNNGGWGAGSHARQGVKDPHAVQADPATTAMVAMALLRSGNSLTKGAYSANLRRALDYLLEEAEASGENEYNITQLKGTQPQIKLGQNIDVVLASQFFTNLLDHLPNNAALKERVIRSNNACLVKIQRAMAENGSIRGAGWAGVLQSSFATNALETARDKGLKVDQKKLEKARDYQKGNFNVKTNSADTRDGAGVMLYSVSGTSRSSAKEAGEAKEYLAKAKREGKVDADAPVSAESLKKSGMSESEALRLSSAFEINQAAKAQAQRSDVMEGFGSNGGEEFLSYLQTGEGLILSRDADWKQWYSSITNRLVRIQNDDGSWSGHHCITSPVFCTATALLILSINNDVKQLTARK